MVRVTIKDRDFLSGLLFYATPLPVLLLGTVFCLGEACLHARRKFRLFWLMLMIGIGIQWLWTDWKFSLNSVADASKSSSPSSGEEVSVLFWNVARRQDLSAAARYLRQKQPDLVGLVEVQGDVKTWRAFWREQLPEYDVSILGGNMYLLTRGTSGQAIPYDLGGGSIARRMTVNVRNQSYEVLLVDVHANPLQPRRKALATLTQLADSLTEQRLLILGDFNTPEDSVHLRGLRIHHQLAFEAAGRGYAPTWPIPLPLMQLDQIWTNQNVIPVQCRHSWTWASDHEPVEAIIRSRFLNPERPSPTRRLSD